MKRKGANKGLNKHLIEAAAEKDRLGAEVTYLKVTFSIFIFF